MNNKSDPDSASKPAVKSVAKLKKPTKDWERMTPALVTEHLGRSVHFSSKTVNSNSYASGVRLGVGEKSDLPFAGFCTSKLDRHVTDYIIGGAPQARPFNQSASVIEGAVDAVYRNCDDTQRQMVFDQAACLDDHFETGVDRVDARLRQILFPIGGDAYVSLSPLHSAPFSVELRARLDAEYLDRKEQGDPKGRQRAFLQIGGANPQNLGRHIYSMQRPIVFTAPTESQTLRRAYGIFHGGLDVARLVSLASLMELATWRVANRTETGDIKSDIVTRSREAELLANVVAGVLRGITEARTAVEPYLKALGGWSSDEVSAFQGALIDPAKRDRAWPVEFARQVVDVISNFQSVRGERPIALNDEVDAYVAMIVEQLR